jgi:hypothetical protein
MAFPYGTVLSASNYRRWMFDSGDSKLSYWSQASELAVY